MKEHRNHRIRNWRNGHSLITKLEQNSLFFCVCERDISSAVGIYIIAKDNESSETILRIRTLTLTTKTVKKKK